MCMHQSHSLFERELAQVDMVLWSGDEVDELAELGLESGLRGMSDVSR